MKRNIQDAFLGALKKSGQEVSIYLQRGVQLKGYVKQYDQFTILLEGADGNLLMIFKHAVTTIAPRGSLQLNFTQDSATTESAD